MKIRNSLLLLLTATIWGIAFVAQTVGMDYVGPFTFFFARSLVGGMALLCSIPFLRKICPPSADKSPDQARSARKTLLIASILTGIVLFFASAFQQFGLLYTTVGKSGFLTACYILLVPLIGLILGRKCSKLVWCAVMLALIGLYFLCLTDAFSVNLGDLLTLISAFLFSIHILLIDRYSPYVDGIMLSCFQFFVATVISAVAMFLFEEPSLAAILSAWKPILYAGVLSSGVGYTLQIIAQRGLEPAIAALIMSLEAVISVLAGWLILGQTMTAREIFGCVLMFIAIVIAQLPEKKPQKTVE